jgi:hypothetical protein
MPEPRTNGSTMRPQLAGLGSPPAGVLPERDNRETQVLSTYYKLLVQGGREPRPTWVVQAIPF